MATPPEQPSRPSYGYHPGASLDFARLPIPGNAEFLVYVIALIVFLLVALIDDTVDAGAWMTAATVTTSAYLLSRGIAKASRVLEQ
ncbi:MAG: hypothetical protein AABM30_09920 [Actinomycetota bacterium]|jgi:hypothetical protein